MKSKYRKAAELVFENKVSFCCDALKVTKLSKRLFTKYFYHPESEFHGKTVFGGPSVLWFGSPGEKENQLARQLALLFMEKIEKDNKNDYV